MIRLEGKLQVKGWRCLKKIETVSNYIVFCVLVIFFAIIDLQICAWDTNVPFLYLIEICALNKWMYAVASIIITLLQHLRVLSGPLVCPCPLDLLSIFHPIALLLDELGGNQVAL